MTARARLTPTQALYELLACRRAADAAGMIDDLGHGRRPADVLVGLIEPVVYQVGADVALGVLGPEVEEGAVALLGAAVERLRARPVRPASNGRRAIAALPPGEEHALGLDVLAALLEAEGWSVARAARPVEPETLVDLAAAERPDLVALSLTTPQGLPAVADLARALHDRARGTRVMVGGLAFRLVPERAVRVGADLFAEDARAALETVRGAFGD